MEKRTISTYEDAVDYINEIPRFTTKNTMDDTRAFLHRLGDPDQSMRIIHVAGTNGKGSVCAYMRFILEAAGYRTAVFTSPHLTDIRERFVIDGEMVSEKAFLGAFLRIYDLLDAKTPHPTFFEYLFLMAMILFSESRPDFCILETGLGGRLDATNAVSRKELAVITRIGLDHTEYLGDTLEKIAAEKAGILQKGAPVVYWDTCGETTMVFRERAAQLGILAYSVSKKDYTFLNFKKKSIDFFVNTEYYCYINLTLSTVAAYQMENASLALRAVEVLDKGRTVLAEHIRHACARTRRSFTSRSMGLKRRIPPPRIVGTTEMWYRPIRCSLISCRTISAPPQIQMFFPPSLASLRTKLQGSSEVNAIRSEEGSALCVMT